MSSTHRILMIDDEPNVLAAYRRALGRSFSLTCAGGAAEALDLIAREEPFAVIVTDMRMPEMNGLEFIEAARQKSKDSVFVMLTGNADQQTAVDAINTGHIYRFLTKPCTRELLESSLHASLRQYEMATAERVLLRETLTGSVKLMVDALELADPLVGAVQVKVKQLVHELCDELGVPYDWQLMVAGSVCLIGLVGTHRDKSVLAPIESMLSNAAELGSRLVMNIPRMGNVSQIIAHQRDSGFLPQSLENASREMLNLVASRLLRTAVDLAFSLRAGMTYGAAIDYITATCELDPRLVDALVQIPSAGGYAGSMWVLKQISVADIQPGMILEDDLLRVDGTLLLSKGQPVSELAASSLRTLSHGSLLSNTVQVRMRATPAKPMGVVSVLG